MKNLTILLKYLLTISFVFYLSPSSAASKSNLAKEKRWEEQIVPSIVVGEDIKLNANGVKFLGLYAESTTNETKGAMILIHGAGVHPAWPDVIEPLRITLPDYGWATLSLQMPILDNDVDGKEYTSVFPEVPARIQVGVDFLKSKGIKNIVISGHSAGATMASYYLSTYKDSVVKQFVILSGGLGLPKDPYMDSMKHFEEILGVRILDIYGSDDLKKILNVVKTRKKLATKIHGRKYKNVQIDGAGHFYREKLDELVTELSGWMDY